MGDKSDKNQNKTQEDAPNINISNLQNNILEPYKEEEL